MTNLETTSGLASSSNSVSLGLLNQSFVLNDFNSFIALCKNDPSLLIRFCEKISQKPNMESEALNFISRAFIDQWLVSAVTGNTTRLHSFLLTRAIPKKALYDAMVLAASNGQLEIVKVLKEYGADIHCGNFLPIMSAVANNRLAVCQYLHQMMGDNFQIIINQLVDIAAENGSFKLLVYLHQNGGKLDSCAPHVAKLIKKFTNIPILEYIKSNGIATTGPEYCRIIHAIESGSYKSVPNLLIGLEPCDKYAPALMSAVGKSGNLELFILFHEKGFYNKETIDELVLFATLKGNFELFEYCNSIGFQPRKEYTSLIISAAFQSRNIKLINRIFELGYPISLIHKAVLQIICLENKKEILKIANLHGIDLNSSNSTSIELISTCIAKGKAIYRPSKAWLFFENVHLKILSRDGLFNFKQSLIQSYFDSSTDSFLNSKILFLIKFWFRNPSLEIFSIKSALFFKYNQSIIKHKFKYYLAGKLLWNYVAKLDKLGLCTRLSEPQLGSPIIATFANKRVSQDLAYSIIEVNSIFEACALDPSKHNLRLAEVGAGYGRLGGILSGVFNHKYCIFDISPALFISEWYLSNTLTGKKIFKFRDFENFSEIAQELEESDVAFFSINQIEKFPKEYFDIAINISSLHEMSLNQMNEVLGQIFRVSSSGVYLKQYFSYINVWDEINLNKEDYLTPEGWRIIFDRKVQSDNNFFERYLARNQSLKISDYSPSKRCATVSILLATFNNAQYLDTSLMGICGQLRQANEIIIVDDGSSDNTREVVARFQAIYGNIRYLKRELNGGQYFAIQQALLEAKSDYVVWAASDDLMLPNFLSESMAQAEANPDAGLIFSRLCVWKDGEPGIFEYSEANHGVAFDLGVEPKVLTPSGLLNLLHKNYLWISGNTVLCKRAALLEIGGFEPNLRWAADWFSYYVVALRYGVVGIPKTLAMMRERTETYSGVSISEPATQNKVLLEILRLIFSTKYGDLTTTFKQCPSILSLYGPQMRNIILRSPFAWSLLPGKLVWAFHTRLRLYRERLMAWKAKHGC